MIFEYQIATSHPFFQLQVVAMQGAGSYWLTKIHIVHPYWELQETADEHSFNIQKFTLLTIPLTIPVTN